MPHAHTQWWTDFRRSATRQSRKKFHILQFMSVKLWHPKKSQVLQVKQICFHRFENGSSRKKNHGYMIKIVQEDTDVDSQSISSSVLLCKF